MNERQSSRSARGSKGGNERKLIAFAVIAVVLLFIGGLIGGAIQSGKVKSAKAELNKVKNDYEMQLTQKDELIDTYKTAIAEKEQQIADLNNGVVPAPQDGDEVPDTEAPADNDSGSKGGGWFGTFIIIFIIVILVILAIYIAYNAVRKKGRQDDEDEDEYDDDEYEDDSDEDDDYDEYDDEDDDE